jgi:dihydropteroate synthase
MIRIVGILNITRDSFSDGGRYLDLDAAIAHARQMLADGADILDVGAESSHPDAEDVPAATEMARLTPIACISVDTYKPEVMRHVLDLGVDFINDITALRDPEAVAAVRAAEARLILMHSTAAGARAERRAVDPHTIVAQIVDFFERRLRELEQAGIARQRVIVDPGMGLFLGSARQASLAVLRGLPRLSALGQPVLVSTSRKSFIGAVLAPGRSPRPAGERAAGTLATELWAARHGAQYIRTHDVRALRDALTLWQAIETAQE